MKYNRVSLYDAVLDASNLHSIVMYHSPELHVICKLRIPSKILANKVVPDDKVGVECSSSHVVLSTSKDRTFRVHDVNSGKLIWGVRLPRPGKAFCMLPDKKIAVGLGADKVNRIECNSNQALC